MFWDLFIFCRQLSCFECALLFFSSELSCVCDLACGWIVMLDDATQKERVFFLVNVGK